MGQIKEKITNKKIFFPKYTPQIIIVENVYWRLPPHIASNNSYTPRRLVCGSGEPDYKKIFGSPFRISKNAILLLKSRFPIL